MARAKRLDETLPFAIATQAGLFAALLTLLLGTMNGMREWILFMRSAIAFLLVSGILKFIAAGVMQAVRWKAKPTEGSAREIADTVQLIHHHSSPEFTEKVPT